MSPDNEPDFSEYGRELDRLWVYRLRENEELARHTAENLDKLTSLVHEQFAKLPVEYVPRTEHEKRGDTQIKLLMAFFTFVQVGTGVALILTR